eukprot:gnl/TRDRNA2_/TRDRNA2_177774_c4_seq2.p2 gnl/TRDRNA2_/TRDRNA2_177774_c4~~gnl/TRDRNA2_/TRDRNA2_177774_c4_seq2.p2  ORF type:complete len:327 (+),score=-24.78 gnl/TRDRNA2_/TRDRNA2_177774_c4_seq2:2204-3184(+)
MGAEITPPSQQQQNIADIEKQAKQLTEITVVTTKTYDKHGNEIIVTTTSPYEQQTVISKSDWRMCAISATNLHLRLNHLSIISEDTKDGYTYILPKNLLKRFICISDLRIQIAGFIFGLESSENHYIREIRCILMPPQWGNYQRVNLPLHIPTDHRLEELEPLGWIHTRPNDLKEMAQSDFTAFVHMLSVIPTWNGEKCISITVAFTPGSCSITAYRVTTQGFEAMKKTNEYTHLDESCKQYKTNYYEKVPIVLSNELQGYFMVPEMGSWNYNFMGVKFTLDMTYKVKPATPKEFYHEVHRPVHFLEFFASEKPTELEVDRDNLFL